MRARNSLKVLCVAVWMAISAQSFAMQQSVFDAVTDARARAAADAISRSYGDYRGADSSIATYTRDVMHDLIENNRHIKVIKDLDQCQFTPDIENRARLAGIPPFEYAWGDMLITGSCVKQDERLGLEYFQRAAEHGYAPAIMKIATFYADGYLLPKDEQKAFLYMKTAAALGSRLARLAFAEMLIDGYAHSAYYELAYSWLYHSHYFDENEVKRRNIATARLETMMPMNIVARARASSGIQVAFAFVIMGRSFF